VRIPDQKFNTSVQDGGGEEKMKTILNATKAEAFYFTEHEGQRGAMFLQFTIS
jgi:hypothetical protein